MSDASKSGDVTCASLCVAVGVVLACHLAPRHETLVLFVRSHAFPRFVLSLCPSFFSCFSSRCS
eukprot:1590352-Pleurochrysis_carterae.AAC.1